MTVQQVYNEAYASLCPDAQTKQVCAFDLSCLLEHCFGITRYQLPLMGDQPADTAKTQQFFHLCKRYQEGEPLQYLLGEWEFYGLPFYVGKGVLIPRPDTETLVETALTLLRDKPNPVVVDLCAGSGCIAVAIAKYRPDAQVFAVELSDEAYPYIVKNMQRNQASVKPIQGDVLNPPALPPIDLVVSNPPYIAVSEMADLSVQVHHEPQMALCDGGDGYAFYRKIPPLYAPLLKAGGAIAFEVGYTQAGQVEEILRQNGFGSVAAACDLAGIQRVVYGTRA